MEDCEQLPVTQPADPISRPNSTSASVPASLPHLPGIAVLAASNDAPETPQLRATAAPQAHNQLGISHAATSGVGGNSLPTCQNCTTSTTPLWRRDEFGSVLCNACGLFLKLHGRPRPISLKTDVIKSRNRVKSMRPDLANKRRQQQQSQGFHLHVDTNGADLSAQNTAAAAHQAIQRVAQHSSGEGHDGTNSPISRTETSPVYHPGLSSFIVDDPYQASFNGTTGADGSMNIDRSLDGSQTHEQLMAHNSSLKTRVSELEVINELFRGRITQMEQEEAAERQRQDVTRAEESGLRASLEMAQEMESQLRTQLEESQRRENDLKRRLDELEAEMAQFREALDEPLGRRAKKARLDQDVEWNNTQDDKAAIAIESHTGSESQTGTEQEPPVETQDVKAETATETQPQSQQELPSAAQAEQESGLAGSDE